MQITLISQGEPKAFQAELNSALKLIERTDKVFGIKYDVQAVGHPGHTAVLYTAFISHEEEPTKTLARVAAES